MSKKDIVKRYKSDWWSRKWLKRYIEKKTTKRKHNKNQLLKEIEVN